MQLTENNQWMHVSRLMDWCENGTLSNKSPGAECGRELDYNLPSCTTTSFMPDS